MRENEPDPDNHAVIVTGSIATDHLMVFPGRIQDQLVGGQLDHISLSFLVDELAIYHGGVAANIAFGLGLLGSRPLLVGAVGADFADYRNLLERGNVDTSEVHVSRTRHTARFLCTTDNDHNQIASFYAGAMAEAVDINFEDVLDRIGDARFVVIGPNDPNAMHKFTQVCRKRRVPFISDPSQQLARMDAADIRDLIDGAELLVTNHYEQGLLEHKTGWNHDEVLSRVGAWIITAGADGLRIDTSGQRPTHVPAHRDTAVVDPTGAGDACRAGLIAGLLAGLDVTHAAEIGCTMASFALESVGTQQYSFAAEQFTSRVATTYGRESAAIIDGFLKQRQPVVFKSEEYA